MEFKNGYKLLYQKLADENKIHASKSIIPMPEDAEITFEGISEEDFLNIKLIYEKDEQLYFSLTGIPTNTDKTFQVLADGELVIGPSGDSPVPPVPPTPVYTPVKYFYVNKNPDDTFQIYTKFSDKVDEPYSDVLKVPENNLINTIAYHFGEFGSISTKLKEVIIPDTIEYIDCDFLGGQDKIETLAIGNNVKEFCKPSGEDYTHSSNFYNSPCIENYDNNSKYVDNWLLTANYGSGDPGYRGHSLQLKSGIKGVASNACAEVGWYPGGPNGQFIIPNTLTAISYSGLAINGCTATVLSFEGNSSLKYIGNRAFAGICHSHFFSSKPDLDIPDSVKYIGNNAFESFTSYSAGKVSIGANCNYIGDNAFRGWHIDRLNVSASEIGNYAFYNACCDSEGVSLGEGITRIGAHAFDFNDPSGCIPYYTNGLTIPNSVKTIGDHAFLQELPNDWNWSDRWRGVRTIGGFYVLDNWIIGHNDSTYQCSASLSSITLKGIAAKSLAGVSEYFNNSTTSTLTYLGTDTFYNYNAGHTYGYLNLTGVTTVEANAFNNASVNLERVLFSNNLKYFGRQNFNRSNSAVYTSNNGEYIYDSCVSDPSPRHKIFRGPSPSCTSTHNFSRVDSNTNLWEDEPNFSACYNLRSITIPKEITRLPDKAFEHCYNLSSISFANNSSLKSIGSYAFTGTAMGCSSAPIPFDLVLPASLENLGQHFAEGSAMRLCDLSNTKVTSIPWRAFDDCNYLTAVKLPGSLVCIEGDAFSGSHNLSEIYYNNTTAAWNQVFKAENWACSANVSVVHCTDGDVQI